MAVQDSTFRTTHVMDNEIVKANDFEFAFEQLVENVSKATQMFLESEQDFVINGKVIPATGMNVSVSPIYGVCKSTGKPFGRTEMTDETIGFAGSSSGRIDIIEVQGNWETYDNQQRAFNDPDTDTQTYQYVDTKKLMKPVYQVKKGVEGAGVAPDVDEGWVKLAEVVINPGVTTIHEEDIKNITSDVAGLANEEWTNEEDVTYNIGYISDVNARFRVQHKADGTHADNCINSDSLDIGIGAKQINGNILPVGGAVSIPTQTIAATDSILSVIIKAALMITSLYDSYLKFGTYGFNGELKISSLLDNGALKKPVSIFAAGDGTAVIKIDNATVLSIDANGKLSTNGYTASNNNHIITKAVTDAISTALNNLTTRVTDIENKVISSVTYTNGILSMGIDGRYNVVSTEIRVATTQNITLSASQIIDGINVIEGDVVLVKNQANAKENGIYTVSGNSVWFRLSAYNTPEKIKEKIFYISGGLTNKQKMFYIPKVEFNTSSSFGDDDIIFLEYMASPKPLANRFIIRDANGRAQVNAPSSENDIARLAEITPLHTAINSLQNQVDEVRGTHGTDITSLLSAGGYIRLKAGTYTITSPVTLPIGTYIEGDGFSTIINCSNISSSGYAITLNSNCQLKNFLIDGGLSTPPSTDGNKGCISIGTANQAADNTLISGVYIKGFHGYGIIGIKSTGYTLYSDSNRIENTQVTNCFCGFSTVVPFQYAQIDNCSFCGNYIGAAVQDGNNIFSNCQFNRNTNIGFHMDGSESPNWNAHGCLTGCQFNHNGSYSILLGNITAGQIFTGCLFFYASMLILNCKGVQIVGSELGFLPNDSFSLANSTGSNLFANNYIVSTTQNIYVSESSALSTFINNKTETGDEFIVYNGTPDIHNIGNSIVKRMADGSIEGQWLISKAPLYSDEQAPVNGSLPMFDTNGYLSKVTVNHFQKLLGMIPSESNVPNTVVKRDSNGYIFVDFINTNIPVDSYTAITNILFENNDGYIRKTSLTRARGVITGGASFITISGNLPFVANTATDVVMPEGFTMANSYIVGARIFRNNGSVIYGVQANDLVAIYMMNNVVECVISEEAIDLQMGGQPFYIMLAKFDS